MALTAREWLLLPKEEQRERGEELSSEECRKLRMELSEIYFTEEEKCQMTEEQKYNFTHPKEMTPEEKEKCTKADFDIMKQWKLLPKEVTYEEWMRRGRSLNWEST